MIKKIKYDIIGVYMNNQKKRCWALTHFLEENETLDDVKKNILDFTNNYSSVSIAIGEIEKTENEKPHCHICLYFPNKISFDVLKFAFLKDHIETTRSVKDYLEYLQKEGLFYSDFNLKNKTDIYESFMQDLQFGFTKKELMLKYPRLFIFHFDNITKMLELYNND